MRDEREKSDRAIAEGRDLIKDNADEVLRHARLEADAVLGEARDKADRLLDESDGPLAAIAANAAVERERTREDAALVADREAADSALEIERADTARILSRLLPDERELTDDRLHAERVQADGALANRDDFLGVVAHDLRDLLSGIVMSTTVIARSVGDSVRADRVTAETERIHRHCARANRLVGDLVDVASIDAGRLAVTATPGDLLALMSDAVIEFGPAAMAKGIALDLESADGPMPAQFDRARLLQVLGNLIGNSIKFSPNGSRIALRIVSSGDELTCSVTDQGPGIPADQIERVFERFSQVAKDDRRGLGLGLFIAARIIDAHAGRIWAESTPGQGTSVLFTIPAHAA